MASLTGSAVETLVGDLAGQVKDAQVRQKALEKLLVEAYRELPANHLDTIPGIGPVTAAILTAKILDPHRFVRPAQLTGLFGIFPVQAASGIDREGKARLPVRLLMSKRGNDLVRRYLWMAARALPSTTLRSALSISASCAKHPDQPSIAIGHVMAKLLRIALAVWKTGKPFDPEHYPWDKPAHLQPKADVQAEGPVPPTTDQTPKANQQAAGHKNPALPERSVVTAVCGTSTVPEAPALATSPPAPGDAACRLSVCPDEVGKPRRES